MLLHGFQRLLKSYICPGAGVLCLIKDASIAASSCLPTQGPRCCSGLSSGTRQLAGTAQIGPRRHMSWPCQIVKWALLLFGRPSLLIDLTAPIVSGIIRPELRSQSRLESQVSPFSNHDPFGLDWLAGRFDPRANAKGRSRCFVTTCTHYRCPLSIRPFRAALLPQRCIQTAGIDGMGGMGHGTWGTGAWGPAL
jgi:hypothetical protein